MKGRIFRSYSSSSDVITSLVPNPPPNPPSQNKLGLPKSNPPINSAKTNPPVRPPRPPPLSPIASYSSPQVKKRSSSLSSSSHSQLPITTALSKKILPALPRIERSPSLTPATTVLKTYEARFPLSKSVAPPLITRTSPPPPPILLPPPEILYDRCTPSPEPIFTSTLVTNPSTVLQPLSSTLPPAEIHVPAAAPNPVIRRQLDFLDPISPISPIGLPTDQTASSDTEIQSQIQNIATPIPIKPASSDYTSYFSHTPKTSNHNEIIVLPSNIDPVVSNSLTSTYSAMYSSSPNSSISSDYTVHSLAISSNGTPKQLKNRKSPTLGDHTATAYETFQKLQRFSFGGVKTGIDETPLMDVSRFNYSHTNRSSCNTSLPFDSCTSPSPNHMHQPEESGNETDSQVIPELGQSGRNISGLTLDTNLCNSPHTPKTPTLPVRSKMRESVAASKMSLRSLNGPTLATGTRTKSNNLPELPGSKEPTTGQPMRQSSSVQEWDNINANLSLINKNIDKWDKMESDIQRLLAMTEEVNQYSGRGADKEKVNSLANEFYALKKADQLAQIGIQPLQFNRNVSSTAAAPNSVSFENVERTMPPLPSKSSSSSINSDYSLCRTPNSYPAVSRLDAVNEKEVDNNAAMLLELSYSNEMGSTSLSSFNNASNSYYNLSVNSASTLLEDGLNADYLRPVADLDAKVSSVSSSFSIPSTPRFSRYALPSPLLGSGSSGKEGNRNGSTSSVAALSHSKSQSQLSLSFTRPRFFSTSSLSFHHQNPSQSQSQLQSMHDQSAELAGSKSPRQYHHHRGLRDRFKSSDDLSRGEIRLSVAEAAIKTSQKVCAGTPGSETGSVTNNYYSYNSSSSGKSSSNGSCTDVRRSHTLLNRKLASPNFVLEMDPELDPELELEAGAEFELEHELLQDPEFVDPDKSLSLPKHHNNQPSEAMRPQSTSKQARTWRKKLRQNSINLLKHF